MRMLRDNCLLEPLPEKPMSDGGIHLPGGQTGDLKMYWKVLEIGPKVKDIEVGNTVITPLHFSHFSMENGSSQKIVDAAQIIGKFEYLPFSFP